jgi:hypothetical protein
MRVVVFYQRSMGERCSSIRYRLQTRRDGLEEAYATDDVMARLREVSSRMARCPMLARFARSAPRSRHFTCALLTISRRTSLAGATILYDFDR